MRLGYLLLGVFVLLLTTAQAQQSNDKYMNFERYVDRSFDVVWAASVQVGSEINKVNRMDKESGTLVLQKASLRAGPGRVSIAFIRVSDARTKIILTTGNSLGMRNAAREFAERFFTGVEKRLADTP